MSNLSIELLQFNRITVCTVREGYSAVCYVLSSPRLSRCFPFGNFITDPNDARDRERERERSIHFFFVQCVSSATPHDDVTSVTLSHFVHSQYIYVVCRILLYIALDCSWIELLAYNWIWYGLLIDGLCVSVCVLLCLI